MRTPPPLRRAVPPRRSPRPPRVRVRLRLQGPRAERNRRARVAGPAGRRPLPDRGRPEIQVTLASSYTGDPAVAQTYATLLGTLPHGAELASLKVAVVPSSESRAPAAATPSDGILACYSANDQTMIVPDDQSAGSTISVNYVIAHEYGHHIAAHRSNAPLDALDFGPKRWSSYELVCSNTIDGKLAPGDRATTTSPTPARPGPRPTRGWSSRLEAWRFTPLLKPTRAPARGPGRHRPALDPARRPRPSRARAPSLQAPAHARRRLHRPARPARDYGLVVKSGGKVVGRHQRPAHRLPDRLPGPPHREPHPVGPPARLRPRRRRPTR